MAKKKSKAASDFRYGTESGKVAWPAVGEAISSRDIFDVLQFLVPPGDDKGAYRKQLGEVKDALEGLYRVGKPASKLTLGKKVETLEKKARDYLGAKHACFLTNATAGFEIAAKIAGLGPDDEVIAPAITFIASIVYPLSIGAKVVLADVDPKTMNLDPADVERKITKKTRMIIPVHIGGYPVDMRPIMRLAKQHDLVVLEDAAHAFGGRYRGKALGTIGHFGAYSFHEVKNVTSFGEGGLLVSNTKYGKEFSMARFLGIDTSKPIDTWFYDVRLLEGMRRGYIAENDSSTEIQAVGLLSQMGRVDRIVAQRRKVAERLNRYVEKLPGLHGTPLDTKTSQGTYHLYLLQVDPDVLGADVQALKKKLSERGVTQIPHFAPLYKFEIMKQLGYDVEAMAASCPVAEEAFTRRFTHLPLYRLSAAQVKYMGNALTESVSELRAGR